MQEKGTQSMKGMVGDWGLFGGESLEIKVKHLLKNYLKKKKKELSHLRGEELYIYSCRFLVESCIQLLTLLHVQPAAH